MDNMNTHVRASLYKCFPAPPGAHSYAKRERYCIACVKTRRNNIAYKEGIMCDSVKLAVIAREEGKTVQREIK